MTPCPKCGNEMDLIHRSPSDTIIRNLGLGVLEVTRYLCYGCLWEKRIIKRKASASRLANNSNIILPGKALVK